MIKKLQNLIDKHRHKILLSIVILTATNIFLFHEIYTLRAQNNLLQLYFLSVGQGDSELIILPGNVKILIDSGPPNKRTLQELSNALLPVDRKIDLIINSHPQLDHMGELSEVMKRHPISAYLTTDATSSNSTFEELQKTIEENSIQNITLLAKDKIKYKDSVIRVLHPKSIKTYDLNETSLVLLLESKNTRALFTGDIGAKTEKLILTSDISNIDVLKVAHHGSKYSSSKEFLISAQPQIAVIEVGKNSYGHPAEETLTRLEKIGAKTLRTDQDGTVKITSDGKRIRIYSSR